MTLTGQLPGPDVIPAWGTFPPGATAIGTTPLLPGAGTVSTASAPKQAHQALLLLGVEVLAVAALAVVADQDSRWGSVVLTLLAVLWLGWLINNANMLSSWFAKLGG